MNGFIRLLSTNLHETSTFAFNLKSTSVVTVIRQCALLQMVSLNGLLSKMNTYILTFLNGCFDVFVLLILVSTTRQHILHFTCVIDELGIQRF